MNVCVYVYVSEYDAVDDDDRDTTVKKEKLYINIYDIA